MNALRGGGGAVGRLTLRRCLDPRGQRSSARPTHVAGADQRADGTPQTQARRQAASVHACQPIVRAAQAARPGMGADVRDRQSDARSRQTDARCRCREARPLRPRAHRWRRQGRPHCPVAAAQRRARERATTRLPNCPTRTRRSLCAALCPPWGCGLDRRVGPRRPAPRNADRPTRNRSEDVAPRRASRTDEP